MSDLNRRDFLNTSAGLAGLGITAGLSTGLFAAEAKAQPQTVRIAIMGLKGRGRQLIDGFVKVPNAEIAYICDPDSETVPAALKKIEAAGRPAPKVETDFRVALEDPNLHALIVAAPDHWHALATIWGCQAGKDVYVEKPCSHNVIEGQRMIAAARKYKRVVQVGTQRRTSPAMKSIAEEIKAGKLGDVNFVRTWITSQRPNIGHVKVSEAPANLDFNLWCGPGPDNGYKTNLVHYNWHWRWDYGTGECGNNGIHGLDVARWGIGGEHPRRISSGGGKYFFDDDQETPDTQTATFDFDNVLVQWEHRTWTRRKVDGEAFGVCFYGSDATLLTNGSSWKIFDQKNKEVAKSEATNMGNLVVAHCQNFVDCVNSRDLPNADIEIGHRSTQLCHLANIAWRSRSTIEFDGEKGTIVNNPAAAELLGRTYRKGFELPSIA